MLMHNARKSIADEAPSCMIQSSIREEWRLTSINNIGSMSGQLRITHPFDPETKSLKIT